MQLNPFSGQSFKVQTGYQIPTSKPTDGEETFSVTGKADSFAPATDSVMNVSRTTSRDGQTTVSVTDVDSEANLRLELQRNPEDSNRLNVVVTNPSQQGAPAVLTMPFGDLPAGHTLDEPLVISNSISKLGLVSDDTKALFFEDAEHSVGYLLSDGKGFSVSGDEKFFGNAGALLQRHSANPDR
jgi:hypothetical protein